MPGYVIHVAIANEYIRKNNIENKKELIDGVVAPDAVTDKSLTHYGSYSSQPNLKTYVEENKINTDYNKGYFIHLITDYLFYNYYFVTSKNVLFYEDYDKTNSRLIEKYNVILPKELYKYMNEANGEPEYLKFDLLEKMIEEISNIDLEKAVEDIKNNNYIFVGNEKVEINVFKRK